MGFLITFVIDMIFTFDNFILTLPKYLIEVTDERMERGMEMELFRFKFNHKQYGLK